MVDKRLFDRVVKMLGDRDVGRLRIGVLQALIEELGEYARATRIEAGLKSGALDEPARVEIVDLMLCGIEAYIVSGGTYEEMYEIASKKLGKWETRMEASRGILEDGR